MVVEIKNYKIQINGTVVIRAEKDPVDGAWALSSEPSGLLEMLLLSKLKTKRN